MSPHEPYPDPPPPRLDDAGVPTAPSAEEIAAWRARAEAIAWFDRVEALVPRARLGKAAAIVNVAIFLAMTLAAAGGLSSFDAEAWRRQTIRPDVESLVGWGANATWLTLHGEPWRLLAAAFLHAGLVHLLVNAYGLWQMGWVERTLGRTGFLVVYLASALAGNVASLVRSEPATSVGASGALFGLVGAILGTVLVPARSGVPRLLSGRVLSSLLMVLAINAFLGATFPLIDNRAHIGGFLAGLVIALAIVRPPTATFAAGRARRAIVAAIIAAAILTAGFLALERRAADREQAHAGAAAELRSQGLPR